MITITPSGTFIGFIREQERVEHFVDLVFIEKIVGIVERHEQHNFLFDEDSGDCIEDLLE